MQTGLFSACLLPVVLTLAACGGSGGGSAVVTVTVSASGTHVSITGNTAQPFNSGGTSSHTVIADSGYTRSNTVGGTCLAGTFVGSVYTTGSVTEDCTVVFSASLNSYTVTPSGTNVSVTPNSAQSVNHGAALAFTVVANANHTLDSTAGGTCPAGSFLGAVYTTGAVTQNCTVTFSATINSHTITPSGTNVSVTPNSPQSVNHGSTRAFTVLADANYTLSNSVGGNCAAGSFAGSVYTTGAVTQDCTVSFSAAVTSTTLSSSVAELAVQTGGVPRTITIANTGAATAFAVSYTVTLPTGTAIAPATCGDIAAAASCVLTIAPGSVPSAAPGDSDPTPVTLSIAGSNTNTVTSSLAVVTLGSVYQSGYLFAIDESPPSTTGIGGTVAALVDQSPPYPNGIAWTDIVVVLGVNEDSTNPPDACNGNVDGACNSLMIVAANSLPARDPPVDPSTYAAGLCTSTIGGYSDWYLPAACEMGYDSAGCGSAGSPLVQNMRSNLVENGNIGNLTGNYWTSTQLSTNPAAAAWSSFYDAGGGSTLMGSLKGSTMGVRCARAVTP